MLAATLVALAIVTQDQSALRAAPRASAPQQAVLWQGDALEVRGRKGDYLQVYDHRRERAGYIRAAQVRHHSLRPEDAAELLAIVRFLRDTPGAEALGIAYAAAYLRAAPAEAIGAEAFDAIGGMAERLARRASAGRGAAGDQATAAHLEVVAGHGIGMVSFERGGRMQLCYDGDAHRRVLALPASDAQKAAAALALTRHECVPPALTPVERFAVDNWRAEVLERVGTKDLPPELKNRLRLRKAGVWAGLAYQRARRPELGPAAAQAAAQRALDELAGVDKSELTEGDAAAYQEAAVRVGASRWAAVPAPPAGGARAPARLSIETRPGEPGETCVHLIDARQDGKTPLLRRCTFGLVWTASAAANRQGTALALAVQPLDAWRELWVFRKGPAGWQVDVLPPGSDAPDLGYAEFAGWVPGDTRVLAVRETRSAGRSRPSFEVLRLATLEVEKRADRPEHLGTFHRWQDPLWKGQTVSLR